MIRFLAVTFLVLSVQVGAQNLHVFEDGQTIDAKRFNDNFTALKEAINSGGSPSDGVAYGSPVWVDSSGTVLTGRGAMGSILWRVNGALETIGIVFDSTYAPNVTRYYSTNTCDPSSFLGVSVGGNSMWVEDGVLKAKGPRLNSTELIYGLTNPEHQGGDCRSQPGDPSSNAFEFIDTGVSAPSWTMDGTQMFEDLR